MLLLVFLHALGCSGGSKQSGDEGSSTDDTSGSWDDTGGSLPPCERPDLVVKVGTGSDSFVALADGDSVTMVHGPQGGWHMLGSVEIGQTTSIVKIHFTVDTVDGSVRISDNSYQVQLVANGECAGYYPGMYGYLDVAPLVDGELDTPPEILAGARLRMRMEVEDRDGRLGADEVEVQAALDPMDGGADTGNPP